MYRIVFETAARLATATLFLILVSLPGCTGSDDPNAPVRFAIDSVPLEGAVTAAEFVPTLDGPLRPVAVSPLGAMAALPPGLAVSVSFSAPMTALDASGATVPSGTVTIEPSVSGSVTWEGSRTLVFRPSDPWPLATRFKVTVSNALPSIEGETMAEPITWTFDTPTPRVATTDPSDGERWFAPDGDVYVRFDMAIDASRARDFVRLLRTGQGAGPVPIRIEPAGDSAFTVRPTARLTPDADFELWIDEGLPTPVGPLGVSETRTIPFRTYGPLRLVETTQPANWWEETPTELRPDREVLLRFSTPVTHDALRAALTIDPPVDWPASFLESDDYPTPDQLLPAAFAPNTPYRLRIAGLVDVFGQRLDAAEASFVTGRLTPDFSMPEGLMILERGRQTRLPVVATNVNTIRIARLPLTEDNVARLARAYDNNHWYGSLPEDTPEPTRTEATETLVLDVPPDRRTPTYIDLTQSLSDGAGVVALNVETGIREEWGGMRTFSGLAIVTGLGLTGKFSPHASLLLVTGLSDAKPVAGAEVTIRDDQGRVRWRGATDNKGRATTPGWAELGIEPISPWESPVLFATARVGTDWTFTSSVYRDGIEPWRFGIPYVWSPEAAPTAGSVFSDRGLYRTGEDLHVKGILRRRVSEDWRPVTDSIRVLVVSPRDELVVDRTLRPGALGTFDFSWGIPGTADQGQYRIRVAAASDTAATGRSEWDRGDLATGTFRVDAFRTATFIVSASSSKPDYVAGDLFEGSISGRYYFGAEMGGMPVRAELSRYPTDFAPPGLSGFDVGTNGFGAWGGTDYYRSFFTVDSLLDGSGRLDRRIFLPGNADGAATRLLWEGSVTSPDGQELAGRKDLVLHPGLFYLGLKPSTGFVSVADGGDLWVDIASVTPSGRSMAVEDVHVELVRREWHSVREVGTDGRTRWRSEPVEIAIASDEVSTQAGRATRVSFRVRSGGLYVIRASATDLRGNRIRSETVFWAAGSGYVGWERTDDDRLELVADRESYAPGETARILVPNPFERATALVTVERDGVISSDVVELVGSAPSIDIPLDDRHLPNVFVGVVLLTGRASDPAAGGDVGAPAFRAGYVQLAVDPGTRHLSVDLSPSADSLRPGAELTLQIRLKDSRGRGAQGEVTLSVADAGVVDLLGYRLPDPFDAFYADRPLNVSTTESRAHLVRLRNFGQKEEDDGGGGGDPNTRIRSDFRPSAYWGPRIRTDAQGRAEVTFRLPESLTTWRVMAVAVAEQNRFGRGITEVTTTQPLVLQPALPRFARVGDRFDASVLVTNRTGKAGTASISIRAEGFTGAPSAPVNVTLAVGETKRVAFPGTTADVTSASFSFEGGLGTERDALVLPIPVHTVATRLVTGVASSTERSAREVLRLSPGRLPGRGGLSVRVASTALVGLDGAVESLFSYPYGCLEQRTSRVRPLLVADELLATFGLESPVAERTKVAAEWLQDLDRFMTSDGFSLWPGGSYSHPYVTAYVLLTLVDARAAGLNVPDDLIRHALTAVERAVRNADTRPAWLDAGAWRDSRAFMLMALARAGRVLEADLAALSDAYMRDAGSSVDGLSYLARAMAVPGVQGLASHRRVIEDAIRGRIRMEADGAFVSAPAGDGYGWLFATDIRTTANALTALAAGPDPVEVQMPAEALVRSLLLRQEDAAWPTTQDNASVVDALAAYHAAYERQTPSFSTSVRTAGRELINRAFQGVSLTPSEADVPLSELADTTDIRFTLDGTGRLYYSLQLESWTSSPVAAADQGLTVRRTFERLDRSGKTVSGEIDPSRGDVRLAHGDMVAVTIRLVTPTDRNYVVVDDALPAGLEPVNTQFATSRSDLDDETGPGRWWGSFNHVELRDDRVLLFADRLDRGEHTYRYLARATTSGSFSWPPASAEAMYRPVVRGRTGSGRLNVSPPEAN